MDPSVLAKTPKYINISTLIEGRLGASVAADMGSDIKVSGHFWICHLMVEVRLK